MAQGYEIVHVFVPEPFVGLVMHLQSCVVAWPAKEAAQLALMAVEFQTCLCFQVPLR
jgi:hypothetical protein